MKNINIIIVFVLTFILSGCSISSWFTQLEDVAIDKKYITKQCPTYNHEFDIKGKKYSENLDNSTTHAIIRLGDLTNSLESYKMVKTTFNNDIIESNQPKIVIDPNKNAFKRIEKTIFVDRECPSFNYSPEFKAKKLTDKFQAEANTTYVVLPLEPFMYELEKSKTYRETYNTEIEKLNSKK